MKEQMQNHPYFDVTPPVVLAHRGGSAATENTLENFRHAAACGVFSIETDVRTTKDKVAVLFHDETLRRLASLDKKISDCQFDEISNVELIGGGNIVSLQSALLEFPHMRFNLDIKDSASIASVAKVVESTKSHSRVLVSSFSEGRRTRTLSLLSSPPATSSSAYIVLKVWLMHVLRLPLVLLEKELAGIGAIQIPRKMFGIRFDSERFIRKIRATKTHVHFWTINNPQEMIELVGRGASGIVSDVSELAVQTLRKA